ncbi:MAG: DUF5335 family protein [Phormidesmis sp.]
MAQQKNESSKQVDKSRWVEFCDMLTDGNGGRLVDIKVMSPALGDKFLIQETALFAIVCDPSGKGNDIVIETGQQQVNYAHTVNAPSEVWEVQDENGKLAAFQIKDDSGAETVVRFLN